MVFRWVRISVNLFGIASTIKANVLNKINYHKIFSGQLIEIIKIKDELEKVNIFPIIKDKNESARLAGFGLIFNGIEIFVHNDELTKSLEIISKNKI